MVSVAIIFFNREYAVKKMVEALQNIEIDHLFLISDAGRNLKEKELVENNRRIMESLGRKSILHKIYATENMGCDRRVVSGLNEVFLRVDRCIILEDDCIPEPCFFTYCNELLEKYKDDERIACIVGTSILRTKNHADYTFACRGITWGWATWRRAWKDYVAAEELLRDPNACEMMKKRHGKKEFKRWERAALSYMEKDIIPWDYSWGISNNRNSKLYIVPNVNMVKNVGFEELATHTKEAPRYYSAKVETMDFPINHPKHITWDKKYDKRIRRLVNKKDVRRFLNIQYWKKIISKLIVKRKLR